MSLPFEIRFNGHQWRVEASTFNNNARVSIWPFYAHHDGTMRPGRGGLQIQPEELPAFLQAVREAAQQLGIDDV